MHVAGSDSLKRRSGASFPFFLCVYRNGAGWLEFGSEAESSRVFDRFSLRLPVHVHGASPQLQISWSSVASSSSQFSCAWSQRREDVIQTTHSYMAGSLLRCPKPRLRTIVDTLSSSTRRPTKATLHLMSTGQTSAEWDPTACQQRVQDQIDDDAR